GGISVLKEIRRLLPDEDVLYYADNAYCPYGLRSPDEIRERSRLITAHLIERGVKAVVVACNTASAMAIGHLREAFPDTPIIGLEPAVKPAVALTKTANVGVLATPRTVAGERLKWLIETHAGGVRVHSVAAPGLVELVEAGVLSGPEVTAALQPLLDPMLEADVDVVVLGCTHYPFLLDAIAAYAGSGVRIIDSGLAIANRTRYVLAESDLLADPRALATLEFLTSANAAEISPVVELLLGEPAVIAHEPVGEVAPSMAGN
ncbi:MAG TPA: glutamate racemase, partial [Thermomicrobiales bacterium]|nr:glutamate racemase [Thermomicrobiales bacterium]